MIDGSNMVGFYDTLHSKATNTNDTDYSCHINIAELV